MLEFLKRLDNEIGSRMVEIHGKTPVGARRAASLWLDHFLLNIVEIGNVELSHAEGRGFRRPKVFGNK